MFINIRNNKDYPFSNLYLITELNFPNGDKIIDTLQYEMSDKTGHFLGKGFTDIKENKLFYKEKKCFLESGKYLFNIRQAMRKNGEVNSIPFLQGVQDVGFKRLKKHRIKMAKKETTNFKKYLIWFWGLILGGFLIIVLLFFTASEVVLEHYQLLKS